MFMNLLQVVFLELCSSRIAILKPQNFKVGLYLHLLSVLYN